MNFFAKLLGATLLLASASFAQVQISEEISQTELKDHVYFLASDELKGRKAGTPEGRKAAEYIRAQWQALPGVELLGEDGFQPFQIVTSVALGPENHLAFGSVRAEIEKDFIPAAFSASTQLTADVVFAGFGFDFEQDSLSWHDYQNVDVKGKWVLILNGDPEPDQPHSAFAGFSGLRKKALVARDHQAAGVLVVSGPKFDPRDELMKLRYDQSSADAGLPVIQIKRALADTLLRAVGKTVADLEEELSQSRKPHSFAIPVTVTASVDVEKVFATTQNVVALIPGSDPLRREEFVVIGAHYDHLGMGGPGSGSRRPDTLAVHNGADDNASGVSAVTEIAERLALSRNHLQRSVVVVAFAAEEMGLLGSKYFTEHPLIPIDNVTAMINMDMIGRWQDTSAVTVGGTGTAVGLEQLVSEKARQFGLEISPSPEGYGPSDHASFYMKDIPVLFFFTNPHEDYHTPNDDADKVNYTGIKKIADFAFELVMTLANREERLVYQEAGPKERPETRRRFKVTLGIMPDFTGAVKNGLRADAVMPGRPAAKAGMKKGDIIVAMEGKPVKDIYDYMNRLSDFEPGQRISVEVLRNGKKVILIVEL